MLRVIRTGVGIALAVMALGLVLTAIVGSGLDGKSTLLLVNRGRLSLSRAALVGSDGSRRELGRLGATDSIRYELKRLGEAYFSIEVTRLDGSGFRTPVGVMVSDNVGIDDTVFVSDSAFRVVPAPRQPYDWPETWPSGRHKP